jgi:shikimate dehydrogenase
MESLVPSTQPTTLETRTQVYCILGDERSHRTRSPQLFSAILQRMGIKGAYVPFSVAADQIGQAVDAIRILNLAGANVTVPFKEAVIPYMDIMSEGARFIGAVNTIVRKDETLKGYNTNAVGFMEALADVDFDVPGKRAVVFGTGGAAKAVVFILNWLQAAEIVVVGRQRAKAQLLTDNLGGQPVGLDTLSGRIGTDIVVNATSASDAQAAPGLAKQMDTLQLSGCRLVVDLNYGYPNNLWQRLADTHGIRFIDGLIVLAHQARRTIALWTNRQVPTAEFLRVLET